MEKLLHINWENLWTPQVSLIEIMIRGTVTYWAIFLFLRFFRRGAGQFSISDILLIILIGDAAQNAMAGTYESITEGIILIGTLVFWDLVIDWLGFKFKVFSLFSQAPPRLLISDGQFQRFNMRKEFITEEDLYGFLRESGIDDIRQVKSCFLESSGNLSVIEKK